MRKAFQLGGLAAGAILIVFGIVAIVMGMNGRSTVNDSLKQEQIVGSADMTPSGIKTEAQQAGIASSVKEWPTMSVANQKIDTGAEARAMSQYMHIHALEASGGFTYAQMGRYQARPDAPKAQLTPDGATNNPQFAAIDPATKQPVDNGARQVWISETALTNALNMSYMASQLALFGVVVGIALLLTGLGFGILAVGGALRNPETAVKFLRRSEPKAPAVPVA